MCNGICKCHGEKQESGDIILKEMYNKEELSELLKRVTTICCDYVNMANCGKLEIEIRYNEEI